MVSASKSAEALEAYGLCCLSSEVLNLSEQSSFDPSSGATTASTIWSMAEFEVTDGSIAISNSLSSEQEEIAATTSWFSPSPSCKGSIIMMRVPAVS